MNGNMLQATARAAILLGMALPAVVDAQLAQPSATHESANSQNDLSEIVVTARHIEERAQDVPISMTVFNQEQLTERNIQTAGDLATYTPSLSVADDFGESEVSSFSIRGFSQALGTTPSVAVYFADAVEPRGGNVGENAGSGVPPGSFFDLQNVQVLKGPQGTLFGRNTDGGAVLIVPKKPTSEFEGYVEGSYGNYAMGEVQAVLNVPLSDNFRVRLGVNHETRSGYLQNITGIGPSDFGNLNYTAARLSAVWDVTNNVENYTIGTYNRSVNNGTVWQLFACNPATFVGAVFCPSALQAQLAAGPYSIESNLPDAQSYLRQLQVINTTTWHASDSLTVKNIANYSELLTSLNTVLWGAVFAPPPGFGFTPGVTLDGIATDPASAGYKVTDQYTWSDELQLQGNAFQNKLTWQAGGYIERSGPLGGITGSRAASLLTCTSLALYQCSGIGQVVDDIAAAHYNDSAAYAQATYSLLEQLKVTGGVRYTSDKMTTSTNQTDRVFPAPNTPFVFCESALATTADGCRLSYRKDSSAPTYMADLDYTPTQDVLLYGKYARGYRQGGVTSLAADQFHLYKPEFVNDYEIGEKTTFRGRINGTFNVDGFFSDFSGQQLYASFLGPVGTVPAQGIVNAGTSHIWGIEVESAITPVRPLTVGLSYTFLNTKVISRPPTALPTGGYTTVLFPSAVNGALPYAPKNKFSTNASYRLPLPESVGNLSYSAIFTYVGSALATVNSPYGTIHPYGLLDMSLNWGSIAGSPVDVELFASNITNRLYYSNADPAYDSTYGIGIRYLGSPRMYGLRVRLHFGQ